MRIRDIVWHSRLEEAQQVARQQRRPLALKALGQGTNEKEDWCPAASATRGLALSDPAVATLLHDRFVPVRFSMWMVGPGTDPAGRDFVIKDGFYPYPGLIITDPELNVLARTKSDADAQATLLALAGALASRPDLAADGCDTVEPLYDDADPAQVQFQALEKWFDEAATAVASPSSRKHRGGASGEREAFDPSLGQRVAAIVRPVLIPAFERWIAEHAERLPDVGAVARALLGDCHYIAGDFARAEATWSQVLELHPNHPIRHRCSFNMLDKNAWPETTHPALRGLPRPGVAVHPAEVPFPDVRRRNLAGIDADPRYVRSPSGMLFARVPAGTFTMGGSPAIYKNELPNRAVTLVRPYLLAAWPVTRSQWREFDPSSPLAAESDGLAGELPCTLMSWHQANAFCAWLSDRDGWRYRLPTEAEWERAARGGLEGKKYPWGDEPLDPTRANYGLPRPVPVASYEPNAFGLFEMVGNVGEYCSDRFHGSGYSFTPVEVSDPTGPTPEQQPRDIRAVRASLVGSPFAEMIAYVSWRTGNDADRGVGSFGFRVAAELP